MSYINLLVHCVFSTKERVRLIKPDEQPRLWAFMGGIARENGIKALAVGGMDDHAHLLLSLPATMPVAKAMQLIKAGSSGWMRETIANKQFGWQEEYGAFTIGISQMPATIRYIENQAAHHKKRNFAQEWDIFLKRHGMKQWEA
ncbi:MAG TPA: IS200/IS605 family transposase [Candidatus Angelobacter sp.]